MCPADKIRHSLHDTMLFQLTVYITNVPRIIADNRSVLSLVNICLYFVIILKHWFKVCSDIYIDDSFPMSKFEFYPCVRFNALR